MFKTKNDLPEAVRAKVIDLLNARLADCIDLQTQTKQAHWNVKGPNFIGCTSFLTRFTPQWGNTSTRLPSARCSWVGWLTGPCAPSPRQHAGGVSVNGQ